MSITRTPLRDLPRIDQIDTALDRFPRIAWTDPAGQGRLAAVAAFAEYTDKSCLHASIEYILNGPAPQAFKDAFLDTFDGLCDLISGE